MGGLLVLGTVACSSGGTDASTDTSSAEKSAVAPETTTAKATTTTTLGPPPPAGAVPFVDLGADAATDGASPVGSGCSPGTPTTLPDGRWFGELRSIDTAASTVGLDLECLFTGDAANAAATADGASEVPVPDDVYIRNESPTIRTLHAVPLVSVGLLQNDGGSTSYEPTQSGVGAAGPLVDRSVWVHVVDGWVVAIQQQYFP